VPDRRRAWAKALFLAASGPEGRAACGDALAGLGSSIGDDERIRNFLSDPSVPKETKAEVIAAACGPAGSAVFKRFCSLVVDKGRIALLPEIARSYGELRDADEGIARLDVEAAREVAGEVLRRVSEAWTIYAGAKTTRATVRVNPSLIAGYRLRAGSLRIDYSIAGRLERLRRELARPLGKPSGRSEAYGGSARGEG
jgi:F-type H+-transporting ATPase subunit delta